MRNPLSGSQSGLTDPHMTTIDETYPTRNTLSMEFAHENHTSGQAKRSAKADKAPEG